MIDLIGGPIWTTSANIQTSAPPATVEAVPDSLLEIIDLVADAGPLRDPRPSTIIDLSKSVPSILREGRVTYLDIIAKTNIRIQQSTIDS